MPFNIKRVPNQPIIIISISAPHDPPNEVPQIHQETDTLSRDIEGNVYRIVDFSQSGLTFSQVVFGLAEGSRTRKGGVADERFVSTYVIGDDLMAELLVQSLAQVQYGAIHVNACGTVDQALALVEKLRRNSSS